MQRSGKLRHGGKITTPTSLPNIEGEKGMMSRRKGMMSLDYTIYSFITEIKGRRER